MTTKQNTTEVMRQISSGLLLCGLLWLSATTFAQTRKPERPPESPPGKPLTVLNNPAVMQAGEVTVLVRGDENPIIRLQMAPNGQTLVEFPARDRIFRVNPADPELVTIEDSPTKETDRAILLRSGRQFLPGSAATSLIVQMTSGMVVTLLIYPVRELEQMAHRCVVRYDREAIISARQAAGLAVHLDQRPEPVAPREVSSSIQMAPLTTPAPAAAVRQALAGSAAQAVLPTTGDSRSPGQWEGWEGAPLNWTKPRHGLRAAAQTIILPSGQHHVRVWLRNELAQPVKIAPGYPALTIRTLDDRGRLLQLESLKEVRLESTSLNGMIPAGQTVRYLLSFAAPVLGARQRLTLALAQQQAADDPVVIELTVGTR